MKILAIETSCDETGIALVEGIARDSDAGGMHFEFTTIKNALLSQAQMHAEYGGVFPNLAKREHLKNLPVLFRNFAADIATDIVDAIAVTQGPGLEPALWTGIEFAKRLAEAQGLPLLPVNHMEGHLISSLARPQGQTLAQGSQGLTFELKNIKLPVLALLISGGHTEFVLMKEWFRYKIIGETLDDAVGECFDKVARMLGLPYPGGPEISKLATQARKEKQDLEGLRSATGARTEQFSSKKIAYPENLGFSWSLPRPMLHSNNCDVSFSGLKTAALYALRDFQRPRTVLSSGLSKDSPLTLEEKAAFAAEFEDAAAEVFVAKTRRALQETNAQTFVIGGGVAANRHIRESLEALVLDEFPEVGLRLPDPGITGDNAVMIAQAALARALSGMQEKSADEIRAVGNLPITG